MAVLLSLYKPCPTSTPYAPYTPYDWLFSVLVPGPRFHLFFYQTVGEGRVPLLLSMIINEPT